MHSGSDVTKTLLKFCSVWHGVCIYWNENIHSVEPCVTHVPHPSLLSSPSPTATGGTPSNTGAQLRMGIFTQKNGKTQGAPLKKIRKRRRGYPFGRGFTGKILRNGKTQEGVPFWKGVYRENFERRKIYIIFVTNNKN